MNQNFIMIFGNKKIKFLLLVFIIFVSIYYYNYNFKVPVYSKNLIQKLNSKDYKYIAHAGGGIEGKIYTNSLEAITNSINLGYKLIEIDLRETNDDVFVGVQSWAKFKKDTNFTDNNPDINSAISYKDFKNLKIFNKYKPVDTNIINDIFQNNKDLIFITDKSNNFKKIYNDFKFDKSRIIVEVFGKKNFRKAVNKGILNIAYAFHSSEYKFVISKEIKIITAGSKDIIENKSMYKDLKSRGILIMAFSSNNEEFIKTNIGKYFTQIYTDFWNISESTCSVLVCKTY